MNSLKKIRQCMAKEKVKAYLIPRTDEFQSEYVAPYAERLRFVTGFSGSAGMAIVTDKQAGFFTDGRYMLQAQDEIDTNEFEVHNISECKPEEWLAKNVKGPVGFDPWLFTETQVDKFQDQGLKLKPLPENLIDLIWGEDQPSRPSDQIFVHPTDFTGQDTQEKCEAIAEQLKENQIDKLLLTNPDSIAWLLNIRGEDIAHTPVVLSYAVLNADGSYELYMSLAKINGKSYQHLEKRGKIIDINKIHLHLNKEKLEDKTLQLDPHSTPVALVEMLETGNIEIVRQKDPCQLLKAIKNGVEIEGTRQAHIRDGVALVRFFAWLANQPLEGETTELSAAQKLQYFRSENKNFYDLSFDTISGYGPHGAVIHYRVSEKSSLPLGKDSLYLVDSGGQYFDGTTDVTRTLCFGEPTEEQITRFTQVLKGHIALATVRFPKGTTGHQLDILARQPLWNGGQDYDHGTGHGVGSFLGVHEGPQGISKRGSPTPLQPGMLLSNEPGYYKEGEYGIRIENIVLVKGSAELSKEKPFFEFETLTLAPLEPKLIDKDVLTPSELSWVNEYHSRVFDTLSPLLDGPTRAWLKGATAPLL